MEPHISESVSQSLASISESLGWIGNNLPETPNFDTQGIESALSNVENGFSEFAPRNGGQYFDKSLENIDEHLAELNETMDHQRDWLHDIHVSLRHLAERKVGHKLGGYWEDQE